MKGWDGVFFVSDRSERHCLVDEIVQQLPEENMIELCICYKTESSREKNCRRSEGVGERKAEQKQGEKGKGGEGGKRRKEEEAEKERKSKKKKANRHSHLPLATSTDGNVNESSDELSPLLCSALGRLLLLLGLDLGSLRLDLTRSREGTVDLTHVGMSGLS